MMSAHDMKAAHQLGYLLQGISGSRLSLVCVPVGNTPRRQIQEQILILSGMNSQQVIMTVAHMLTTSGQ
jgi:hypothetical protein